MNESTASYRRILKSTSLIGGASLANLAIGLVRMKALAVVLGPVGMGLASLLNSLLNIANSVATMGLGSVGTRQIAEADARDDQRQIAVVRRALFLGTLVIAVFCGLLVWSLRRILAVYTMGSPSYAGAVGWVAVGVALAVGSASQSALIQGMRRIGDIARLNVIGAAGATTLGLASLWIWGSRGLVFYVISAPIVTFAVGHIYVAKLKQQTPFQLTMPELTAEWKIMIRLCASMLGASLVNQLAQFWIRIDISNALGPQALGQYQAAWTISMQYVTFVLGAMGTDYYPRLTGVIHDRKTACNMVNEQAEIALLLSAPVLLAFMALTPVLVCLLYSQSFGPAVQILRWQILGDVLKIASWPLSYVLLAGGRGRSFFLTECLFWMLTSGLISVLMPRWGLMITGIAYMIAYMLYLVAVYLLARRQIGFTWNRTVWLQMLVSFLLCAAIGAIASISVWGQVAGAILAAAFGLYSFVRIAHMGNLGGPAGKLSVMANRLLVLSLGNK